MQRIVRARTFGGFFVATAVLAAACNGETTTQGGESTNPMCGAVLIVPPVAVVIDAKTGALVCNPIFTVVGEAGAGDEDAGGAGIGDSCGSTSIGGCPKTGPDGGSLACVFALFPSHSIGGIGEDFTIEVAAPGYASTLVSNVHEGAEGCVETPTPASQLTVTLTPL